MATYRGTFERAHTDANPVELARCLYCGRDMPLARMGSDKYTCRKRSHYADGAGRPHVKLTMDDVRRRNAAAGFYFFEPDTLRFFRSRVSDILYGGRFFVTSEDDGSRGRRWTIREAMRGGDIRTVEPFYELGKETAHRRARELARAAAVEYGTRPRVEGANV